MAFCSYCGNQVPDDAKFCKTCGKQLDGSIPSRESVQVRFTERKQEYAGTIVKCPSCGEILPSFTAICPTCGHEITSAKVPMTIEEFSRQIKQLDMAIASNPESGVARGWPRWNTGIKVGWVFLNILAAFVPLFIYLIIIGFVRKKETEFTTFEEKQKISFINNYIFPNDRESILEALLYFKAQVSQQTMARDKRTAYGWIKVWKGKADELYQRAEIMFPEDPIVKNAYTSILENEKKIKRSVQIKSISGIVLSVFLIIFFVIMSI